jgi:cytochrome c oxidase cbb3-type subunit III
MSSRLPLWPAALLAVAALPLAGQHGSVTVSNPYNSPADLAAGMKIFRSRCAGCHGPDGSGGSGPDLTTGNLRHGASDDAIFQSIAKGVAGTPMPAFDLNGREIWQLVGYVRSIGQGKAAAKAKGDPRRGAGLYRNSGCVKCHSVGGDGGQMGPDLTSIGARRSLGQLERALRHPDEEVPLEYWSIRAKTKSGRSVSGIRLNEDTFSFQILDSNGKLQSVSKADLVEHQVIRNSPMPSFESKLQKSQFDDLIAYLASLR